MRTPSPVVALLAVLALLFGAPPAGAEDPEVERLSGPNRFATAAAVSASAFGPGVSVAFIATGQEFADALASGPVAASWGGPILLVTRDAIPEETTEELRRLRPGRLIVLGGAAAVSEAVVDRLRRQHEGEVERWHGSTRYGTAALASARTFAPGLSEVMIASGQRFPDALSGAAAAGSRNIPILLVAADSVPEETVRELRRLRPGSISVLGGESVISDAVMRELADHTEGSVTRVSGTDRFSTSAAVSRRAFRDAGTVYLATGMAFPDALAAGPVAGDFGAPILLATRDCVPQVVLDEIDRLAPDRVVLLGGPGALGRGVERLASCDRQVSVVQDGLQLPWDVVFTPDGRTYVSERDRGRVLELTPEGPRQAHTFAVGASGEGGLLGLAVSPTYAQDQWLYAYVSSAEHGDNRVVRFRPGDAVEPILVGIPHATVHDGGRIAFGPDDLLYVATGDARVPERAQDTSSLAGKVLRVTPDGGVPSGNPFGNPVWALGLRNPQGLSWDDQDVLYATDFGADCDDEVNRIERGGNYGWPDPCGETRAGAIPPVIVKQPPNASWSGASFLHEGAMPEWEGDLFVAALRGQRLWRFRFDIEGRLAEEEQMLVGDYGRLRHVTQAPDGALWVLTSNGSNDRIVRIGPSL